MIRKILTLVIFIGHTFCAHAQDVFDLRVSSFETVLKSFSDAKYQPQSRCEEFVERRHELNSLSLYVGAVHCSRQNSLVDAATLLAMADVKFQFDQIRYPVAAYDKDALLSVAFIRSKAFSLYGNARIYEAGNESAKKIVDSLQNWNLDFLKRASPGWLYSEQIVSNQDLAAYWINLKNSKASSIETAEYFLQNPDLVKAKQNWMAAARSLESARTLRTSPDADANPHALAIVRAMEQHEKNASEVYFRVLEEMDDAKRPYVKNFEKSTNVRDLMAIDPTTLNPTDEIRGSLVFSLISPSVRDFRFNLDAIQSSGYSADALHFMSFCVADLIARSVPEFKGWQIGSSQRNLSDLKFRVKLLKSEDDVLRDDGYTFSDPVWLPNESWKQSCRFIRRGYFRIKNH
jgi:hypothetical protein